jgi:hypothetical protein
MLSTSRSASLPGSVSGSSYDFEYIEVSPAASSSGCDVAFRADPPETGTHVAEAATATAAGRMLAERDRRDCVELISLFRCDPFGLMQTEGI